MRIIIENSVFSLSTLIYTIFFGRSIIFTPHGAPTTITITTTRRHEYKYVPDILGLDDIFDNNLVVVLPFFYWLDLF